MGTTDERLSAAARQPKIVAFAHDVHGPHPECGAGSVNDKALSERLGSSEHPRIPCSNEIFVESCL